MFEIYISLLIKTSFCILIFKVMLRSPVQLIFPDILGESEDKSKKEPTNIIHAPVRSRVGSGFTQSLLCKIRGHTISVVAVAAIFWVSPIYEAQYVFYTQNYC